MQSDRNTRQLCHDLNGALRRLEQMRIERDNAERRAREQEARVFHLEALLNDANRELQRKGAQIDELRYQQGLAFAELKRKAQRIDELDAELRKARESVSDADETPMTSQTREESCISNG